MTVESTIAAAEAKGLFVRFLQQTPEFWEATLVPPADICKAAPAYSLISARGDTVGEALEKALTFADRCLSNLARPKASPQPNVSPDSGMDELLGPRVETTEKSDIDDLL